MRQRHHPLFDPGLRLAGLGTAALGTLAIHTLWQSVHVAAAHPADATELMLAVVGFLCLTGGAMLAVLGAHVTDRVAVSSRWHVSPRRDVAPRRPAGADRPLVTMTER